MGVKTSLLKVADYLRWTGLIPFLTLAWFGLLNGGLHAYSFVEARYCGSGPCNASGTILLRGIEFGTPALSALAIIFLAVMIAPAHKVWVNWLTLALGSLTVIGLIAAGIAPLPHGLITIGVGYLAARWLALYLSNPEPDGIQ